MTALSNDNIIHFTSAQTSREVKKHLTQTFARDYPGLRFLVTTKNGSLRISWIDGPCEEVVQKLVSVFEGAKMVQNGGDSIKGYKEYVEWNGKKIHFGLDFVFLTRTLSYVKILMVMQYVEERYDCGKAPQIIKTAEGGWKQTSPSSWQFDHFLSEAVRTFDAHDILTSRVVEGAE